MSTPEITDEPPPYSTSPTAETTGNLEESMEKSDTFDAEAGATDSQPDDTKTTVSVTSSQSTSDPPPLAEEGERGEWGNHCEYFLTSLGLAVGLGNVWRFPYLVYQNGGGTFLVPYLICLLLLGLPLFFLEMLLGQYVGQSATKVFSRMAPGLKGFGYGMLAIPTMMTFYYTIIMAWSWYYMFQGFRSELPWASCNTSVLMDVATPNCFTKYDNDFCGEEATFYSQTCMEKGMFCQEFGYTESNGTHCLGGPMGDKVIIDVTARIAASEEFYKRKMLKQDGLGVTQTWSHYGEPQWEVMGCLALSWTVIAVSLVQGMQSYGKLTYFITLFPYVVLTTFLAFGSQKEGFSEGITDFYMKADWDRLFSDFDIWIEACTQIFYSLGVAVGSQLLLCSYNKFDNNCHRDVWLIGLGNSLTSIYAGFVVFGTLGMLAHNNGVPIEKVITAGEGLTFQAYPEAIAQMEVPPLFNFLFFFMLCLLAMSSIVGMWEPTVAAVLDELPMLRKYRTYVYLGSCFVAFLGGLPCCFPGGIFLFNLLNDHTANTVLYFGLVEVVLVAWCYGVDRFLDNAEEMKIPMPRVLRYFWKTCWVFISPLLCLVMVILGLTNRQPDSKDGYVYPDGAQALGWMIEMAPVAVVVLVTLVTVLLQWRKGGEVAFLRAGPLVTPTSEWGPREDRPKDTEGTLGQQNLAFYHEVGLEAEESKKTELE